MHWLASEKSGDFGKSLRFMGNLANAEETSGNFKEAILIEKRIVDMYPNTSDAGWHIVNLSALSRRLGDIETSKLYLTKLVEGDYPEEYRQMGKTNLDSLLNQLGGAFTPTVTSAPPEPPERRHGRFIFFLVNILLLTTGAIYYFWVNRKKPMTQSESK